MNYVITHCPRDAPLLERLTKQIRALDKSACILLIEDNPSLNTRAQPVAWLARMLDRSVAHFADGPILKLDPDCWLERLPQNIPRADLFGVLSGENVRGGCYGFSRAIAFDILRFGVLRNLEIQKMVHPDKPNMSPLVVHEELQMSRAVQLLGRVIEQWDDINIRWRPHFKENEISSSYSVWHPVK